MAKSQRLRNPYEKPLFSGLVCVVLFGFLTGCMMDMGESGTIYGGTLITYAALSSMILLRRPKQPTPTDLLVLKYAFPALYFAGFVVYPYAWHLRGVR